MIETRYGDKIAGHVNRDSTAIDAREKAAGKKPEKPKKLTRTGRTPWPQSQGGRRVSNFGVFRGRERR